jgi:hypothetical protein
MSNTKNTIYRRTHAYISGAARKQGYRGKELHRAVGEVNWTLGEMERGNAGLVERIEAALLPSSRKRQGCPDGENGEMSLLRMAIGSVIEDKRVRRPVSKFQTHDLRIYESNFQSWEGPEEKICRAEYETFLALVISAAFNELDEREKEIFLARYSPERTIQEVADSFLARYSPERTIQEAADSLSLSYSTYWRKLNDVTEKLQDFISKELKRFYD